MSYCAFPPELKERAKRELNEDEDESKVREDIEHIKECLKKQPHLKARQDDNWILAFLRGCKFSLEKTKKKLDFYYTARSMLPELFRDRDPLKPEIQEILNQRIIFPLFSGDASESSIIFFRYGGYDPAKIKMETLFKMVCMCLDIDIFENNLAIINGMRALCDFKSVTLAHAPPVVLSKKFLLLLQSAFPRRMKEIFSYKEGSEKIFETIRPERFPNEYGGQAGTLEELAENFRAKLKQYREWFIEDEQYGADESKRPGKPKSVDELFGIEGSFRKLNID